MRTVCCVLRAAYCVLRTACCVLPGREGAVVKRRGVFVTLTVALLLLGFVAGVVAQEQGVQILQNRYSYTFNKELVFELAVQSEQPIPKGGITLLYRIGDSKVVNRRKAAFQPGKAVVARVIEKLEQGEIPPMSAIHYRWQIRDAAGNVFKVEEQTFLYMDDRFKWKSKTEGPITIYWYDGVNGERLLDVAVQSLQRLETVIGYHMEMPIKIVTYKDKHDMDAAMPPRGSIFDEQVVTLGTVVAPDIMLLHGTHADVDNTIAHELTHIVVHAATKNPYAEIPAWLDEGLAMYNQNFVEPVYSQVLEDAVRKGDLDTVQRLNARTGNVARVNLWYAEVWSLIDYLVKTYGEEKMAQLLEVFSHGAYPDDALMKVYGFDQRGLTERWWKHLGAKVQLPPLPTATMPAAAVAATAVPTFTPVVQAEQKALPSPTVAPPPAETQKRPPATSICGLGLLPLGLLGLVVWWGRRWYVPTDGKGHGLEKGKLSVSPSIRGVLSECRKERDE